MCDKMTSKIEDFGYNINKLDQIKNMLNTFREKSGTRNEARNLKQSVIGLQIEV